MVRVPEDCLTKVVGEFLECPTLGFVQCRTTPLRAEDNYWEVSANIASDTGIFISLAPVKGGAFFFFFSGLSVEALL